MTACRTRLLVIALLAAGALFVLACGDGATTEPPEIALSGPELRDFMATLLLTQQDIPGALENAPAEEWRTDSSDGSTEPLVGPGLQGAGWLGTLSRPIIVKTPQDTTFTVGNTASAFTTTSGAAEALDFLKESDVDELGKSFVAATSATTYEVRDLDVSVGDDAWSLLLVGPAESADAQAELTLAMVGFRRGPIMAVITTLGSVEFGDALLRQLAETVDGRIQAGLAGL